MKNLLKFLYFIAVIVLIVLLAGIFLPNTFYFSGSVKIPVNSSIIFEQINSIKNWKNWNTSLISTDDIKVTYLDSLAGKGAGFSWESKENGSGTLHITNSTPYELVEGKTNFYNSGICHFKFSFQKLTNALKVTHQLQYTEVGYFERYYLYLFGNKVQDNLERNLDNLKNITEELRLSRCSEISALPFTGMILMTRSDSSLRNDLHTNIQRCSTRLTEYLKRRNLTVTGEFMVLYSYPDTAKRISYSCAFPISDKTWGWKHYKCIEIDSAQLASIVHWGNYTGNKPFLKLQQFFDKKGYTPAHYYWETYQVKPVDEPDTSLWKKTIYMPFTKK